MASEENLIPEGAENGWRRCKKISVTAGYCVPTRLWGRADGTRWVDSHYNNRMAYLLLFLCNRLFFISTSTKHIHILYPRKDFFIQKTILKPGKKIKIPGETREIKIWYWLVILQSLSDFSQSLIAFWAGKLGNYLRNHKSPKNSWRNPPQEFFDKNLVEFLNSGGILEGIAVLVG